ncbi:MAG: hypothetical protein RLZZ210_143 [Pseudomonadota bacterium]|jgi:type II secretion system protein J
MESHVKGNSQDNFNIYQINRKDKVNKIKNIKYINMNQYYKSKKIKNGFTLIEVLVAIAIMATIATIGYQTIESMIKTENNLKDTDKILNQIQKTFSQWQSDCSNIELRSIPNLSHNIKVFNNQKGEEKGLWIIRRNTDENTKSSVWQLVIYNKVLIDNNKHEWQRIALEPTNNNNDLIKQTNDINDIIKNDEIQTVSLIPIQKFSVNIWQELKWQSYWQMNNQIPIRGLQLNLELDDEWKNVLGKVQKFNCITKVN